MKLLMAKLAMAVVAVSAFSTSMASEPYPKQPIRLVVPFSAGATTDALARLVGESVAAELGGSVVIENRPGAAGIIATTNVKRQPADGHVFMLTTEGIMTVNPHIYKDPGYDPIKDFDSLSLSVAVPNALVVKKDSPFQNITDLISYAKANPNKLSYGSAGIGSSLHIAGELLNDTAGVNILHIPYKGGSNLMSALLGGEVPIIYVPVNTALRLQSGGEARILGIGSSQRHPLIKDVPTFKEQGIDYESDTWYGFSMPAGANPDVAAKLSQAINKALAANSDKLNTMGLTVVAGTPKQLDSSIQSGIKKWQPLIEKIGLAKTQ